MQERAGDNAFRRASDGDAKEIRQTINYYGNCTRPARLPSPLGREMELAVRCRNCPSCLRSRQHLWRLRAELEVLHAPRTWMFTGTFSEQFHDLEPVGKEVTRYLKRLRHSGRVRYLVCPERHKSGAWHCHMLIHCDRNLSWRAVTDPWKAGFFKANIASVEAAGYVTKYVTKDMGERSSGRRPRIRASRNPRYGDGVMQHEEEIVQLLKEREVVNHETWTTNLKQMLKRLEKTEDPIWKLMTMNTGGSENGEDKITAWDEEWARWPEIRTIDHQQVNRTTGEIKQ